ADFHVLEDLGQRQRCGAGDPRWPVPRAEKEYPGQDHEPAVHLDHARDVATIAVTQLRFHLVVDGIEFPPELRYLLGGEASEGTLNQAGHGVPLLAGSELDLDRALGRVDAGADHLAVLAVDRARG